MGESSYCSAMFGARSSCNSALHMPDVFNWVGGHRCRAFTKFPLRMSVEDASVHWCYKACQRPQDHGITGPRDHETTEIGSGAIPPSPISHLPSPPPAPRRCETNTKIGSPISHLRRSLAPLSIQSYNGFVTDDLSGLELRDAAALPRRWTYEQTVAELPESNRLVELWDGQLVMSPTPSLAHQRIVLRFARQLEDWTEPRGLGIVFIAPLDMVLSPHRVTQPDVGFVSSARTHIIQRVLQGPADLVAEVISLGGRNRDRIEKRDLYEQHGVQEYWIIDPESQSTEVLFLEPTGYRSLGRFAAPEQATSKLLSGFRVSVDTLFRSIPSGV